MAGRAGDFLMRPMRVAPTLMKYAEPNAYEMETRHELEAAAKELLAVLRLSQSQRSICSRTIRWRLNSQPRCCISIRITRIGKFAEVVSALPETQRREIVEMGLRHRGRLR